MNGADGSAQPHSGVAARAAPGPIARVGWMSLRLGLTLLGFVLFLPVITGVLVGTLLLDQAVPAPSWIVAAVEERAEAVLDGGGIGFGDISVRVGNDLHPRVEITDAVLRDAEGRVLVRVPLIAAQISPRGLILRRQALPQVIRLVGAEIALQRDQDGRLAVALGGLAGDATGVVGQAENLADLFEQFDLLFDRPGLEALEAVEIEGLIARLEDSRAGRVWTVDGGEVGLYLTQGETRVTGEASLLSGRSFVTRASFAYESPKASPAARIGIVVTDAAAEDIAAQSPSLGWLSVLDAPLSAAFRIEIDGEGEIGLLSAAVKLGKGALSPVAGARPVGFDLARAYFTYDPGAATIRFGEIEVESDWGGFRAEGQTLLEGMAGGSPEAFVGQFRLDRIAANPAGLYSGDVGLAQAFADLRVTLSPFRVSLGQVTLTDETGRLDPDRVTRGSVTGEIGATPDGWSVALDAEVDALSTARLMELWPVSFRPGVRGWFEANVTGGEISDFAGAFRLRPGQEALVSATYGYAGMEVRVLPAQPVVSRAAGTAWFQDAGFVLTLDEGWLRPPQGGEVDLAGTALIVQDTRVPNPPATLRLQTQSTITAALAVLDAPPFGFIRGTGLPVTLADGRVAVDGDVTLPLGRAAGPGEVRWDLRGQMTGVRSTAIVPGRLLAASTLEMRSDPARLEIGGALTLDGVPAEASWRLPLNRSDAVAEVRADVELSPRAVDVFELGLPEGMVSGQGVGQVVIRLPPGAAPEFELTSDLAGLGLSLPQIGWSLARSAQGDLAVEGTLGPVPEVSRIALDAPGLVVEGSIGLREDGTLERARFGRARVGGWFEGAVDLVGRGAGSAVGLEVRGGRLDLTQAEFGSGGEGGGPISATLDEVRVAEGVVLTGLIAELDATGGIEGRFVGKVNGGPAIEGRVAAVPGGVAIRAESERAGDVLRAAGYFDGAEGGGRLELWLTQTGRDGEFDGRLAIDGLRVNEAPALAQLLNAVSVVGLLQQMSGQGIVFDEVRADFRIDPERIVLSQASAVGVGLGLSLDGVLERASGAVEMQGVLSPFYLFNAVGEVLTRRGEGLLGFSFRLTGEFPDVEIAVNPLSVLTPGMFREIFRRPPPG